MSEHKEMPVEDETKCEDCGKADKSVRHVHCPFMDEIHNEKVLVRICSNCYHERCMEI